MASVETITDGFTVYPRSNQGVFTRVVQMRIEQDPNTTEEEAGGYAFDLVCRIADAALAGDEIALEEIKEEYKHLQPEQDDQRLQLLVLQ